MNDQDQPLFLPSGPLEATGIQRKKPKRVFDNAQQTMTAPGGAEKPRRPRTGGKQVSKGKRREPRGFVQAPVKVPQALLAEFIKSVRYMPKRVSSYCRFAVANVMYAVPGASDYPPENLWDAMGRWNSSLRGMKEIEGITEKHHGWEHVQRLLFSMARAENDPALQGHLKRPSNQFLREVFKTMDKELSKHFAEHPEDLMTPDEFFGSTPLPDTTQLEHLPLFKRPPSKPGPKPDEATAAATVEATQPSIENDERAERKPQRAILFGG